MVKQVWIPTDPVGKPRMTQSDKWQKRPAVMKYRNFCDILRPFSAPFQKSSRLLIIFEIPMPRTWSKKKRLAKDGTPHQQRPDIDNLLKAVLDAFFEEDKFVYHVTASKIWKVKGSIFISEVYD